MGALRTWVSVCLLVGLLACGESGHDSDTGDDTGAPPPQPPTFQEFLLDWYADYDANQDTSYLLDTGTVQRNLEFDLGGGETLLFDKISDAHYGPHGVRTTMDIYSPVGITSAPAVVFVHGGGFASKSKENAIEGGRASVVASYVDAGYVVASINYRFRRQVNCDPPTVCETVVTPDWDCAGGADETGCRLDVIYRDGARAIQYLRHRSDELNIDPNRIGAWGSSAGSQIVAWVGLVPDLAVAGHPDPVLRQSTRIQAIGHRNSQATGPSYEWPFLVEFDSQQGSNCDQDALWVMLAEVKGETRYSQSLQLEADDAEQSTNPNHQHALDLERVVSYLDAMDSSDPPFITSSPVGDVSCEALTVLGEAATQTDASDDEVSDFQGKMLHHPRHGAPLYEECLVAGLPSCDIANAVEFSMSGSFAEKNDELWVRDFMLDHL